MTVLVGAPAPETNRRNEMALVAGRQRIWRFDDGKIALADAGGDLGSFEGAGLVLRM